jgi:hypothetical protein
MRFRPANIRLINRRSNLPRLLLVLSSGKSKSNDNYKNNPTDPEELTRSLHIRPSHSLSLNSAAFQSLVSINAHGNADPPRYASAPDSTRNADYRSLSAVNERNGDYAPNEN